MDANRDYTPELHRMMSKDATERLPLAPYYIVLAERVVMRCYPPRHTDDVFRILTALNLLNAAVKQSWGKKMVGYRFIKGYASLIFRHVILYKTTGVDAYWDSTERIVYFRVYGIQLGFHYIPFTAELRALVRVANGRLQTWDGYRLQQVPVELFLLGNPEMAEVNPLHVSLSVPSQCFKSPLVHSESSGLQEKKRTRVSRRRQSSSHRIRYACSLRTLRLALSFHLDDATSCMMYRRQDRCHIRLAYYTGHNYEQLISYLSKSCPMIYQRKEHTLKRGSLYYVSPQLHIESLMPSRRLAFTARNCYLWDDRWHCCHNLCVSYGIARYLTLLFPELRFINLLNFNRVKVRRRYYSHAALLRVPFMSQSRRLKVWMVVDRHRVLRRFDVSTLPRSLIDDYYRTPDYYQAYEITKNNGLVGLYAHRWHHLLPPVYQRICIHGYYAYVTRTDGKVAVYALQEERFKSPFIYDRIWHVPSEHATYGQIGDTVVTICRLHPEMPFPACGLVKSE